ncbi:unnamed protein product [Chondrus crispus]|uniref:Uncharacterized protein n=1 Tax=Chondrus crispus TaxID=2769 RepID=R7QP36_CHOCR|nr:unnamed protein product [Chondrus crispus]CDF39150.1 unnamed protein product [Chondrus crispus]|eukprot:XP_005719061.1 unnamed protein product [Chondrus crispus]
MRKGHRPLEVTFLPHRADAYEVTPNAPTQTLLLKRSYSNTPTQTLLLKRSHTNAPTLTAASYLNFSGTAQSVRCHDRKATMPTTSLPPTRTIGFVLDVSAASLRPPPRESAPHVTRERHARKLVAAVSRLLDYHKTCSHCQLSWSYRFFDSETQASPSAFGKDEGRETSEEELEVFRRQVGIHTKTASVGAASMYAIKYHEITTNLEDGLTDFSLCLPGLDDNKIETDQSDNMRTTLSHCTGGHPFQPLLYVLTAAPDSMKALSACHGASAFLQTKYSRNVADAPTPQDMRSMISNIRSSVGSSKRVAHTDPFIKTAAAMESQDIGLVWVDTRPALPGVFSRERASIITAFCAWLETVSTSASFIDMHTLLLDERVMPVESHIAQIHPDAQRNTCEVDGSQAVKEAESVEWNIADVLTTTSSAGFTTKSPPKDRARDPGSSSNPLLVRQSSMYPHGSSTSSLVRYFRAQLSTNFSQDSIGEPHEQPKASTTQSPHVVIILRGIMPDSKNCEELYNLRAFESSAQVLRPLRYNSKSKDIDGRIWAEHFGDVMTHLLHTSKGLFADVGMRGPGSSKTVQTLHSVLIRPLNSFTASVRKVTLNVAVPRTPCTDFAAETNVFGDTQGSLLLPDLPGCLERKDLPENNNDRATWLRKTRLCEDVPQRLTADTNERCIPPSSSFGTPNLREAPFRVRERALQRDDLARSKPLRSQERNSESQPQESGNNNDAFRSVGDSVERKPNPIEKFDNVQHGVTRTGASPRQCQTQLTPLFEIESEAERDQDTELSDLDVETFAPNRQSVPGTTRRNSTLEHIPKSDANSEKPLPCNTPLTMPFTEGPTTAKTPLAAPSVACTSRGPTGSSSHCPGKTDEIKAVPLSTVPELKDYNSENDLDQANHAVSEAAASFQLNMKRLSEHAVHPEQCVLSSLHNLEAIARVLSAGGGIKTIEKTIIDGNIVKDSEVMDALDATQRACRKIETAAASEALGPEIWLPIIKGYGQVVWQIVDYAYTRQHQNSTGHRKGVRHFAERSLSVLSCLQMIGAAMATWTEPHSLFVKTFTYFLGDVLAQFTKGADADQFERVVRKIFTKLDLEGPTALPEHVHRSSPPQSSLSTCRQTDRTTRQSSYQQLVRASSDKCEQSSEKNAAHNPRRSARRALTFENEHVGEKRSVESFLGGEHFKKQQKGPSIKKHKKIIADARTRKPLIPPARRTQISTKTVELLTTKRARRDSPGAASSRTLHKDNLAKPNNRGHPDSRPIAAARPALRRSPRKNQTPQPDKTAATTTPSPQACAPKRRTSPRHTQTPKSSSTSSKTGITAVAQTTPTRTKRSKKEAVPDWSLLHVGRLTRRGAKRLADMSAATGHIIG